MGNFLIICPDCGTYQKASNGLWGTGLFGTKRTRCQCGKVIDIKSNAMTSVTCPSCKNPVIMDVRRGEKAKCPVCKAQLLTPETVSNFVDIPCPGCGVNLHVPKGARVYVCAVCDTQLDLNRLQATEALKKQGEAVSIQNNGASDLVVWRHPLRDFVTGSTLIVREGQQAVFLRNGEMLDSFGPGRYTLTTDIKGLVGKAANPGSSGMQPFSADVYFINMTTFETRRWGLNPPLRVSDPATGVNIEFSAHGTLTVQVTEPRRLIAKLVGPRDSLSLEDLFGTASPGGGRFLSLVISKIKTYLASFISQNVINVLDLDAYGDSLASLLKTFINDDEEMKQYGLTLDSLHVLGFKLPSKDDSPDFWRIRGLHNEGRIAERESEVARIRALSDQMQTVIRAQGEASANQALGVSFLEKEILSIIKDSASSLSGSGSASAANGVFPLPGASGSPLTELINALLGGSQSSGGNSPFPAEAGVMPVQPARPTPPANPAIPKPAPAQVAPPQTPVQPVVRPVQPVQRPQPAAQADTITCPGCGKVLPKGSKFCLECGQRLTPAKLFCPSCGKELAPGSKFCVECGQKLQ